MHHSKLHGRQLLSCNLKRPFCLITFSVAFSIKRSVKQRKKREIKWDKLDNTAHIFPVIAGESMSNVYRISVTLHEEVQQELLQEALERVLPWFEVFSVRIRYGVFSHWSPGQSFLHLHWRGQGLKKSFQPSPG